MLVQGQLLRQVADSNMDDEVGLTGRPSVRNLLEHEVILDRYLLHHHLVLVIIPGCWKGLHGLPAGVDIVTSEQSEASHNNQHLNSNSMRCQVSLKSINSIR